MKTVTQVPVSYWLRSLLPFAPSAAASLYSLVKSFGGLNTGPLEGSVLDTSSSRSCDICVGSSKVHIQSVLVTTTRCGKLGAAPIGLSSKVKSSRLHTIVLVTKW